MIFITKNKKFQKSNDLIDQIIHFQQNFIKDYF